MSEQISGDRVLDHLANRLFLVYEQFFGLERAKLEFPMVQKTVLTMLKKLEADFGEIITFVSSKDKVIDLWVEFESDLRGTIDSVDSVALATPDLFSQLRSLILAFQRDVKKIYGPQKAAGISVTLKEYDSKRVK